MTAVTASADTMVITYRSCKVQTVPLDQPSDEVRTLSYKKGAPLAASGSAAKKAPVAAADQSQVRREAVKGE